MISITYIYRLSLWEDDEEWKRIYISLIRHSVKINIETVISIKSEEGSEKTDEAVIQRLSERLGRQYRVERREKAGEDCEVIFLAAA
jgi:hypothetical protein